MKARTIAMEFAVLAIVSSSLGSTVLFQNSSDFPERPLSAWTSWRDDAGGGYRTFDNFRLSAPARITRIGWIGFHWDYIQHSNNPVTPPTRAWQISFYADRAGSPSNRLYDIQIPAASVTTRLITNTVFQGDTVGVYSFTADLPIPFAVADTNNYWLSPMALQSSYNPPFGWMSGGTDGDCVQSSLSDGITSVRSGNRTFTLQGDFVGQAPCLLIDRHHEYPRVAWNNFPGETYRLLLSERLVEAEWAPLVILTSDSVKATWTDEAAARQMLFYRLTATAETNWASKLQAAFARALRDSGAKGGSAVVITTNDIWQGTTGLSDASATNSIQPQMRFSIGSITKTFTTALIMRLAEDGRLSLDDPLSRWLPWLTNYPNITINATIRQLLSHTSGIFNFTDNPSYRAMVTSTNRVYKPQEVLGLVQAPDFVPGSAITTRTPDLSYLA